MKIKLSKEVNLKWHWIPKDTIITLPFIMHDKKNKRTMEVYIHNETKKIHCHFNSQSSLDGYRGGGYCLKENEYKIINAQDETLKKNEVNLGLF